jgi:hypothetical protein
MNYFTTRKIDEEIAHLDPYCFGGYYPIDILSVEFTVRQRIDGSYQLTKRYWNQAIKR